MARIVSKLDIRELKSKYRMLINVFIFDSDLVGRILVPRGFICDYESVPIIEGSSKRAGVIHDYLYRIDSAPNVPKEMADRVYNEVMEEVGVSAWRRFVKYQAVKWFGRSSYHKLNVFDTLKTLMAR